MANTSANRATEDDGPWRLVRVARAFARALALAETSRRTNGLNDGLVSLRDHKGDLTATWRSEGDFWLCYRFIESELEDEYEHNVIHKVGNKIVREKA